nr:SPOR domain-containing protein [Marinobacter sp. X15-166B]
MRWILSLAAVGGFIGFIVYLNSMEPAGSTSPAQPAQSVAAPASSQVKPPQTPPKKQVVKESTPNFRFYEMLPDSEVVPPKVNEYTPNPTRQNFDYLIQTGSFRRQEDAERQRAQIAFQGIRASVDRIDMDGGNIWYRVNVGPFESRSRMNATVDKLVGINIQPLVRKIPKKG